jgi:small-conductance mechanosensitive channel
LTLDSKPDISSIDKSFNLIEDNFMADEAQTQSMLKSILERIEAVAKELHEFRAAVEGRLTRIEIRLDKIEAIALEARAIAQETQLDLKHLREQLNLPVA